MNVTKKAQKRLEKLLLIGFVGITDFNDIGYDGYDIVFKSRNLDFTFDTLSQGANKRRSLSKAINCVYKQVKQENPKLIRFFEYKNL